MKGLVNCESSIIRKEMKERNGSHLSENAIVSLLSEQEGQRQQKAVIDHSLSSDFTRQDRKSRPQKVKTGNLQDVFLNHCRRNQNRLKIMLFDGSELE